MAVYKRGKTYWYSFWFNGVRYQASAQTKNLRAAQSIESKAKTDLALGEYGLAPRKAGPFFRKYSDQFKEYIHVRNKKRPRTIDFYEEKLKRLLEFKLLADCRINLIDESIIEEYIQCRTGKGVKGATINRELSTLRRALRVAWKVHKLIRSVPTITLIPGEEGREFVLGDDLEQTYLAAAEDTLRDFAILSLDTGIRAGEGVALEWDKHIFFEPLDGAKFGHVYISEGKSKNARRRLSMTPRVKVMLQKRRRFITDDKLVFPSDRKKEAHILVSSLDHQHVRARNRVNEAADKSAEPEAPRLPKEFVIHSLRHTFGTRLGETGASAFEIMRIMGHSSVTVSQKYVHPTPESLERAFERLESRNQIMRGEREAERKLGVPADSATSKKRKT